MEMLAESPKLKKNIQNCNLKKIYDFWRNSVLQKWSILDLFPLAGDRFWGPSRGGGSRPSQNRRNPRLFQYVRFRLWINIRLTIIAQYGLGFVHQPCFTLVQHLTPAVTLVFSICRGTISLQIGVDISVFRYEVNIIMLCMLKMETEHCSNFLKLEMKKKMCTGDNLHM
jgi:hypothetical protein